MYALVPMVEKARTPASGNLSYFGLLHCCPGRLRFRSPWTIVAVRTHPPKSFSMFYFTGLFLSTALSLAPWRRSGSTSRPALAVGCRIACGSAPGWLVSSGGLPIAAMPAIVAGSLVFVEVEHIAPLGRRQASGVRFEFIQRIRSNP